MLLVAVGRMNRTAVVRASVDAVGLFAKGISKYLKGLAAECTCSVCDQTQTVFGVFVLSELEAGLGCPNEETRWDWMCQMKERFAGPDHENCNPFLSRAQKRGPPAKRMIALICVLRWH